MDLKAQRVWKDGQEIILSALEFNLLVYLARNSNRYVSPFMIFERVWGESIYDNERVLGNVYTVINRLRTRLQDYKHFIIKGRAGFGYMVDSEDVVINDE